VVGRLRSTCLPMESVPSSQQNQEHKIERLIPLVCRQKTNASRKYLSTKTNRSIQTKSPSRILPLTVMLRKAFFCAHHALQNSAMSNLSPISASISPFDTSRTVRATTSLSDKRPRREKRSIVGRQLNFVTGSGNHHILRFILKCGITNWAPK
jgi:hypothetical protein